MLSTSMLDALSSFLTVEASDSIRKSFTDFADSKPDGIMKIPVGWVQFRSNIFSRTFMYSEVMILMDVPYAKKLDVNRATPSYQDF